MGLGQVNISPARRVDLRAARRQLLLQCSIAGAESRAAGAESAMNDEAVRALIADHLAVEPEQVTDFALFGPDLGADSLDLVQLTMLLEERLGVSIDDHESEQCLTVGEALHLVRRKLSGAGGGDRAAA